MHQQCGETRDFAVGLALTQEGLEIVKPIGIEQAEPREVTGDAKLLGRGSEEEQARRHAAEMFDNDVLRAWRRRRPREMVCFVDDHDVPAGIDRLLETPTVLGEERQVAEEQLVVEEWIRGWIV